MVAHSQRVGPARPPRGALRVLLRLPIWCYRAGLGRLFGDRLVLLHHCGRKSGRPRLAVLEVIRRDERAGTYYVVSGWGEESQWVRNVMARPDVVIQTGRRLVSARAVRLPADQGAEEIVAYARCHPVAFRWIARWLGWTVASSGELQVVGPPPPVFAFRPTSEPSEPLWLASTTGGTRSSDGLLGCHWA